MLSNVGWVDRKENVLAADEKSTRYSVLLDLRRYHGHLGQHIRAKIADHALMVVLHGYISYKDILGQQYVTEFMGYHDLGRFTFEFRDREAPKYDDAEKG